MARIMMEGVGMGGSSLFIDGMSSEQRCQSTDSLAEWRSCEQLENGMPSTSPSYWDTNDDDDCGAKPSDLFGKFIWNIEKFSLVNKREMKSNAFEAGGYKWCILMYPQGCDVSNHLSLFLCVANHDKLLPGWSRFAQFTIVVENTDPKKSKFSDTLHCFSKKEHDWGWKRFMELSKLSDGFIVADTLVIKAQVQVIREKAHRPFHCLDRQYRRELLQIYLSNVEQICRRFVEERRGKLSKLIEDKMRWLSFRAFWLGIDQNARRCMSRDKADAILKAVVKHFFIEKEVTSTLVMDSLCSGLKALECQSKNKKGRAKLADMEELPASMVHVEKDMFVLADDVLLLLERVALEPLPRHPSPPKNDKGSQRRSKDGSSGEELNKDSILRDERRLTELGRRTVEIFVFAHIFSRIEVAFQEAVALKRQEELIREEEAAGQIENELKAKRGAVKEKRSKKKQGKHKRNTRKSTDRGKEKSDVVMQNKHQTETPSDRRLLDFSSTRTKSVIEKIDTLEEASDVSDAGDVSEAIQPELDDRDASRDANSVYWDRDASEIHPAMEAGGSERQNGQMDKRSPSIIDDSCSTCSTDSVLSVVMNGSFKGSSLPYSENQTSPVRVKSQCSRDTHDRTGSAHCGINSPSDSTDDAAHLCVDTDNCRDSLTEPETVLSLKDQIHILEQHLVEKEGEVDSLQKKLSVEDQVEVERPYKSGTAESSSLSFSPGKKPPFALQQPKQQLENTTTVTTVESVYGKELSSISPIQTEKSVTLAAKSQVSPAKSEAQKLTTSSKSTSHQVSAMSSPSAPLIASPRPPVPIVSTVQTTPLLSHSITAVGRLATDPSPLAPSYIPQLYRNAIVGKTTMGTSLAGFPPVINSTSSTQSVTYSQSSSAYVSSMFPPQTSARNRQTSPRSGVTGSVKPETLHSQHQWIDECSHQEASSSSSRQYRASIASETKRLDIYGRSSIQAQGTVSDEFPHLAIINDLLDEDQSVGKVVNGHHHSFNRQYTFPHDASTTDISSFSGPCRLDRAEQYYNEGFQRVIDSPHELRDAHLSQMDCSVYANGQIDVGIQKQWPYCGTDLSMLNLGCVDANGHSYRLQDYLNSSCGENGHNLYRSASWL